MAATIAALLVAAFMTLNAVAVRHVVSGDKARAGPSLAAAVQYAAMGLLGLIGCSLLGRYPADILALALHSSDIWVAGLLFGAGGFLVASALETGDSSTVTSLIALKMIFVVLVSLALGIYRPNALILLGVVAAVIATYLVSWTDRRSPRVISQMSAVLKALAAGLAYGTNDSFMARALATEDPIACHGAFVAIGALAMLPFLVLHRQKIALCGPASRTTWQLLGAGALFYLAVVSFMAAVYWEGNAVIPNIISATRGLMSVLLVVVMARFSHRVRIEKTTRREAVMRSAGGVVIVLAVALATLGRG